MMKVKRPPIPKLPYSLHDARINSILIDHKQITFKFKEGFYEYSDSEEYIHKGSVILEDVDFDYTTIMIMKVKEDHTKSYKSKDYTLKEFLNKYKKYELEIIDEYYGYHSLSWQGWLWKGSKIREFIINISFNGNMYYCLEGDKNG